MQQNRFLETLKPTARCYRSDILWENRDLGATDCLESFEKYRNSLSGLDAARIYPALTDDDLKLKKSFDYCGQPERFNVRQTSAYREVFKTWVELHRPPDLIMDFSFKSATKPGPGHKTLMKFLRAYARRTKQHLCIMAFWDVQPHRTSQSVHFHVLIWFEHQYPMIRLDEEKMIFSTMDKAIIGLRCWEAEWTAYTGGIAFARPYDPDQDGAAYAWDHHDEWNGGWEFICPRCFHSCNKRPDRTCQYEVGGIQSQEIASWRPQDMNNPKHHYCSHRQGARRDRGLDCS